VAVLPAFAEIRRHRAQSVVCAASDKLSLVNVSQASAIEVDNARMKTPDGSELLANGDFRSGLDRWFFAVDNDKPWHIWSLPVQVLFDVGWFGLTALTLLLMVALWRAGVRAWRGDMVAGAVFAAVVGFMVIGSMGSLVDSPRLLLLLLLLAWACSNLSIREGSDPDLHVASDSMD